MKMAMAMDATVTTKTMWLDLDIHELTRGKYWVLATTGNSFIYLYCNHYAAKVLSTPTELEMMIATGTVSIPPYSCVLKEKKHVRIVIELRTRITVTDLDTESK